MHFLMYSSSNLWQSVLLIKAHSVCVRSLRYICTEQKINHQIEFSLSSTMKNQLLQLFDYLTHSKPEVLKVFTFSNPKQKFRSQTV